MIIRNLVIVVWVSVVLTAFQAVADDSKGSENKEAELSLVASLEK